MDYGRWSVYDRSPKGQTLYASLTHRVNSVSGNDVFWHLDSRTRFDCLVVEDAPNARFGKFVIQPESYSSRFIFYSNRVLPYDTDDQENKKFLEAATQYTRAGRIPRMYRITDFTYSDDLGRIYHVNQSSGLLEFKQFKLTRGSGFRNDVWIRGYQGDVSMPAYVALSLSGLNPEIQSRVLVSSKFDAHHIEENLFDLRPSQLICLPTWMHRKIHSLPLTDAERFLFVKKYNYLSKRVKRFYLLVFVATWKHTTLKGLGPLKCLAAYSQRVTVLNTAYSVFLSSKMKKRLPVFPEGNLSLFGALSSFRRGTASRGGRGALRRGDYHLDPT